MTAVTESEARTAVVQLKSESVIENKCGRKNKQRDEFPNMERENSTPPLEYVRVLKIRVTCVAT